MDLGGGLLDELDALQILQVWDVDERDEIDHVHVAVLQGANRSSGVGYFTSTPASPRLGRFEELRIGLVDDVGFL